MQIDIDPGSGFCFGVTRAIERAEEELKKGSLYCLGDIVHNGEEVSRLANMGLITINHEQFAELKNAKVLLRAHGEPPSTYKIAEQNGIQLFDASCPVVLGLQRRIREAYQQHPEAQIVIFGKEGHAEVVGLVGQTEGKAIVVENLTQVNRINFEKDIYLFSQTTKSVDEFEQLVSAIADKLAEGVTFEHHNTICRNVSSRVDNIRRFAAEHDVVFFVGGKKSSNAKVLFHHCQEGNPGTVFVSSPEELDTPETLATLETLKTLKTFKTSPSPSLGICGATSTPQWLMQRIANKLNELASMAK